MQNSRRFAHLVLLFALLILSSVKLQPTVQAQSTDAEIRITGVDTSAFPLIKVYLTGDSVAANLEWTSITLDENSIARPILDDRLTPVGVDVAFLLDAASNIDSAGLTGQPRHLEAGQTVRRLVRESQANSWLQPATDYLMSISVDGDRAAILADWSQDHQAVVDQLYLYNPAERNLAARTPLNDLIFFSLDAFNRVQKSGAGERQKAIVVFSDGFDAASITGDIDAVNRAAARNVQIHTVLLGPVGASGQPNKTNEQQLQRIALLTGGNYVHLEDITDVDAIWQGIANKRMQRVITYRAQTAALQQITVRAQLSTGQIIETTTSVPSVPLQPITVHILEPEANYTVIRIAENYDTPTEQLSNPELPVRVDFEFPDGYPRTITRAEYEINGAVYTLENPSPDSLFILPIRSLDGGDYTLRIRAFDELNGPVSESFISLSVQEQRPSAPTPTPNATLIAQGEEAVAAATAAAVEVIAANTRVTQAEEQMMQLQQAAEDAQKRMIAFIQGLTLVSGIGVLFGIVGIVLSLYVLSSRERRQKSVRMVQRLTRRLTNRLFGVGGGRSAQLVLVKSAGATEVPKTIDINPHGSIQIGREPSMDVVIDNDYVSGAHCKIHEDGNGDGFRIINLSRTNITMVNHQPVDSDRGKPLHAKDIITIGKIEYRFDGPDYENQTNESKDYGGSVGSDRADETKRILS